MKDKYYVYVLRSVGCPEKLYVGHTDDMERRLGQHNAGSEVYSKRYAPWELVTYVVFSLRAKAAAFEKYLKTPSGKAFMHKRLV